MKIKVEYKDLGLINYKDAWDYQEDTVAKRIKVKFHQEIGILTDKILFCEHPHVYTLGKSGSEDNLLMNYIQMQAQNVEFFRTNRGGDITYHGPGQIVGYPIVDLDSLGIGIKQYIHLLEESIIRLLKHYDIDSSRLAGATGVWLDADDKTKSRKICAIGVKVSRGITMHGFALNINTDLSYFDHINPCGFTDKGVTSLSKELKKAVEIEEVKKKLLNEICEVFGFSTND